MARLQPKIIQGRNTFAIAVARPASKVPEAEWLILP